ncbi:NAD(P)/FAD-dependent oxidoreductase [Geovibrio thiophilus]|uniref:NAD(P)/FAD-dependent oxidoreductase n=1 Tax=Geovibrio thiophilus TaxID=139438 RepID=A0A3R5YYG3_9BACT|nr:NAD(P)/FAD-dependent oxidoreductase [Geovibrio thiophilus]QAR32513.1 NAD(P)/FAD-dependent oxidoreductase [Geovibrio thiophilus]
MTENFFDVAVIGGGAAGLMASGFAASAGAKTVLLERGSSLGRKLLITGGGRCNLTNNQTDIKKLTEVFGKEGRFLYSAFSSFSPADTLKFFSELGVACAEEDAGRVFPDDDDAKSVLRALTAFIRFSGVKIWTDAEVKRLECADGRVTGIILENSIIRADRVVIATGGLSYPATGSKGDGYKWAERCGHTIVPLRPVLTPVKLRERWIADLEGLSLRDVSLSAYSGKKIAEERSDLLFTGDGMTGPVVYNISRRISGSEHGMRLLLDIFPDETREELDKRLAELFASNDKKMMKTALGAILPPKLLPVVIKLSALDGEIHGAKVSKVHRKVLLGLMKELETVIDSFHGFNKATVTAGGVNLREVDPKTMKSKIIENLYFAGEVLDLDAPTGGYNLQMCWSTGALAGKSAGAV